MTRKNDQNASPKIEAKRAAKAATARNLWIPAVNNAGTWGRWAFVEIADPWDMKNTIRAAVRDMRQEQGEHDAQ